MTFGQWQVSFGYDATNHLTSKSITNASGIYAPVNTSWQFRYDTNGLLSQIIDPRGNTNVFVQYDQYGRETNRTDAIGRSSRTEYNTPNLWQMRHADAGNFQWIETFDHKGHVLARQDPLTNITRYSYDTNGNRTSITEPLGWTTYFGYDSRAKIISKTNAVGEVSQWVIDSFFNKAIQQITPQSPDTNGSITWTNFYQYDSHGNLTNQYDALGNLVRYTYLSNGLVFTSTDANGNTTKFGYDTNGFLKTQTDTATNTTTFAMNEVGWKTREVNALIEPTTYQYDFNGNITRIQDALSRVYYHTNDPNGNLLATTDAKWSLPTADQYDAANQRTSMTDRTGTNKWLYFYTPRGKIDHQADPLNDSITNTYDAANRLIYVWDPLGHAVTNQYDANGNLIYIFDKLGRRWSKTYDRLNRLETESDPIGNTKHTIYDVAGRIKEVDSPNGFPSVNTYDGRGRLVNWHDPQNFNWHYDYDGVGNITNITDALQGHYVMVYSNRNERISERNQDGFQWRYAYDKLLRLKTQTDPNLIVRSRTYDAGGRLKVIDFSTGREDTFDYDDNDNMRLLSKTDGSGTVTSLLVYDLLDRLQEEDEPNGQTVLYGHDSLGRVTSITYPGGKALTNWFDPLNRLTNQVDWAGHTLTYVYDVADRLRSRTYPNGVVQTNDYDDAGRITALTYSSQGSGTNPIGIVLTYAYDRNGNKIGGGESGTLNWTQPDLTDDQANFSGASRLISRQIQNNSATSNQLSSISYHYDASGNLTNATGNGENWTLAYDEGNRATAIVWSVLPMMDKPITNRYDALGRRISRATKTETNGYVLDLSGGMERILCDLDGNGSPNAWYIHGLDLCYKVDSTNGITCYHADALGNVIALTGGKTNLSAQYAYTPYGRCLGLTNSGPEILNPYLFVGSQGVMNEFPSFAGAVLDPGLSFMRARYYLSGEGAFLSTDPLKKIGPTWKPVLYGYAEANPVKNSDPTGQITGVDDAVIVFGASLVAAYGAGILEGKLEDEAKNYLFESIRRQDGDDASLQTRVASSAIDIVQTAMMAGEVASPDPWTKAFLSGQLTYSIFSSGKEVISEAQKLSQQKASQFTTFYSPTAGTTPMAIIPSFRQPVASRTVTIAAPKANLATVATTTRPSGTGGYSTSNGNHFYTVRSGDTLGNIGYANGTTAGAIWAANPGISNPNLIYPGQVITIPHR